MQSKKNLNLNKNNKDCLEYDVDMQEEEKEIS